MTDKIQWLERKNWQEFRDTGLIWFVNRLLHLFGWVIVYEIENNKIMQVYPARTKFRGFDPKCESDGFTRVTDYLRNNAESLYDECLLDEDELK